jgi:hypothetical protein
MIRQFSRELPPGFEPLAIDQQREIASQQDAKPD